MGQSNSDRLLRIRELLFAETDEDHALSIKGIQQALEAAFVNETFDRRTIRSDIEALSRNGFDIIKNEEKYGAHVYSHQNRLFEVYQLRLMIDAILSAKFITTNEKDRLVKNIKQLTSKHVAKKLPETMTFSQSTSVDYELVKLNIDRIHEAISSNRVIRYKYGRYNVDKQFAYRRDGEYYYVEPYALIWQNDYYYLIGKFQETGELRHYRLDRMRHIQLIDKLFTKDDFSLQTYVNKSFHMYGGEDIHVKVRFVNDLINVVLDRFGMDANIETDGPDHFILRTRAKQSAGLVHWLLTWGSQAKVLSPKSLVEEVTEKVSGMFDLYND
ncbi:MAG TPA: WYL domain-containing protein [Bacillota bacterium]|nr:WYL domain-containing protein [Bacillota bacterium]